MKNKTESNSIDIETIRKGQKQIYDSFAKEYQSMGEELETNLYLDLVLVETNDETKKNIAIRLVIPGEALLLDISSIESLQAKLIELKKEIEIYTKLDLTSDTKTLVDNVNKEMQKHKKEEIEKLLEDTTKA